MIVLPPSSARNVTESRLEAPVFVPYRHAVRFGCDNKGVQSREMHLQAAAGAVR